MAATPSSDKFSIRMLDCGGQYACCFQFKVHTYWKQHTAYQCLTLIKNCLTRGVAAVLLHLLTGVRVYMVLPSPWVISDESYAVYDVFLVFCLQCLCTFHGNSILSTHILIKTQTRGVAANLLNLWLEQEPTQFCPCHKQWISVVHGCSKPY